MEIDEPASLPWPQPPASGGEIRAQASGASRQTLYSLAPKEAKAQ